MKQILTGAIVALSLCGCTHKAEYQMVKPLPTMDIENITDATVPAEFSLKDFGWKEGMMQLTIYSEDLYDAAQVSKLKVGDTLVFDGKTIIAKKIENKNGILTINNGIEEGGACLAPHQGGTYRGMQLDDHSIYTKLGMKWLPVSKDFTIIDCGENPSDPSDTIKTAQRKYLENLPDYRQQFGCLDTRVKIEGSVVTNITRHWIP